MANFRAPFKAKPLGQVMVNNYNKVYHCTINQFFKEQQEQPEKSNKVNKLDGCCVNIATRDVSACVRDSLSSTQITQEKEILYKRRLKEGYDLVDKEYEDWKSRMVRVFSHTHTHHHHHHHHHHNTKR